VIRRVAVRCAVQEDRGDEGGGFLHAGLMFGRHPPGGLQ
jgi:hypothetical protein